jgi:thymidine phosphorylase
LTSAPKYLPRAPLVIPIFPLEEGYVSRVDARGVGNLLVELGGGRQVAGQTLDLAVGLSDVAAIGTQVGKSRPLATVHARSAQQVRHATEVLQALVSLSDKPVLPPPIIHEALSSA